MSQLFSVTVDGGKRRIGVLGDGGVTKTDEGDTVRRDIRLGELWPWEKFPSKNERVSLGF